jgi:acyl-CoA thioester hydrolase
MPRIKISLPATFSFSAFIPVRITDINYGGHVGNDAVLSLIHEARMQYLKSLGTTELAFGSGGLIMSDVAIEFKQEIYYGETVKANVKAMDLTRVGFDLVYKLSKEKDNKEVVVALAKTGMVCFDYAQRKVIAVPAELKEAMFTY